MYNFAKRVEWSWLPEPDLIPFWLILMELLPDVGDGDIS